MEIKTIVKKWDDLKRLCYREKLPDKYAYQMFDAFIEQIKKDYIQDFRLR